MFSVYGKINKYDDDDDFTLSWTEVKPK